MSSLTSTKTRGVWGCGGGGGGGQSFSHAEGGWGGGGGVAQKVFGNYNIWAWSFSHTEGRVCGGGGGAKRFHPLKGGANLFTRSWGEGWLICKGNLLLSISFSFSKHKVTLYAKSSVIPLYRMWLLFTESVNTNFNAKSWVEKSIITFLKSYFRGTFQQRPISQWLFLIIRIHRQELFTIVVKIQSEFLLLVLLATLS